MITAGIDVGIENVKVVILRDGKAVGRATALSGGVNRGKSAEQALKSALSAAGLSKSKVDKIVATGQGKGDVALAADRVTEPMADTRAARFFYPKAACVVDIGADQVRIVTLGEREKILEVVMNQKCAAGLGILIKSISRTLGMTLDEISRLSGSSPVSVHDGCTVFAEMDTLSLLNRNVPREDIARAVVEAVAVRINSILNDKIKPAKDATVLVGGLGCNQAVVAALKRRSGVNFIVPDQCEYAGALGAALIAAG